MSEHPSDYFSTTYSHARAEFLGACVRGNHAVDSYTNPMRGPLGERLVCDVTRLGPVDAEHVVVVTSATHGAEGFCGSGIQVGLLRAGDAPRVPQGVALILVHALNPYGFAWIRRVNEDNVDLNRNFVDHAGGNYPENDLFDELVDGILPTSLDDDAIARCRAIIAAAEEQHGEVTVRKASAKGQYRYPESMAFGGTHATWSNRTLHSIFARQAAGARTVALIDLHSGLGPYGYGELMTPSKPGEEVFDRFHGWYGSEVHSTTAGKSDYAGSKGSILAGFHPPLGSGVRFGSLGVEFGTLERPNVRDAVRDDHWLHVHGQLDSDVGREIKARLRDAFYCDKDDWKKAVWSRGQEVVGTALEKIAEE
jgi:hypothetical protein